MMYVRVIFFFAAFAKTITAPRTHDVATTSEITAVTDTSEITEVAEDEVDYNRDIDQSRQKNKSTLGSLIAFEEDVSDPESYAEFGAVTYPLAPYDAHALYTNVSCKFAKWTINRLYVTLGLLKEFDEHKDGDSWLRDEILMYSFERSVKAYKKTVEKTVTRFVQVLHDILETDRERLYYSDKTVLKTFVSLRIKSHYIVPAMSQQSNAVEHLLSTIRLLLADMIALQRYHSMNCPEPPSTDRTSYFYGFSIDDDSVYEDIKQYLRELGHVPPAASASATPMRCTVSQTMWRTLVQPMPSSSSSDSSSLDRVSYAGFAITENRWMMIGDVLLRVEQSYDSDVVFWYQKSVFNAIVETLLHHVNYLLNFGDLHEHPQQCLRFSIMRENFYLMLSPKFESLPEILVDVTENLYKTLDDDDNRRSTAILGLWQCNVEIQRSIRVQRNQPYPTAVVDYLDVLEEILTTISENITDFECYHLSLKYLHDEDKRAYIPFVDNKEDLLTFYPSIDNYESENTCKFLLNVYSYCLEIFSITNKCRGKKSAVKCTRISELLSRIKNFFLIIVKNRQTDVSFLKMSYNVAIILVNLTISPQHLDYIKNVQQILGVIMTELNNNGLKYCTKRTFNFLLFNNIHFGDSGAIIEPIDTIESSIKEFLIEFDSNLTDDDITKSDSQLDVSNTLSLNHLNTNFIKHSRVFNYYDKKIKFYWKGTLKTTKTVYENLALFAPNPLDLNAFYDIYFKFYIAVVYFEIKTLLVLNDNNEGRLKNGLNIMLWKFDNFQDYYFPEKLKYIISDIANLYSIQQDNETTLIDDLHKRKEKIDEEFKKLNITIDTKQDNKIRSEPKSLKNIMKIPKMSSSSPFSSNKLQMFITLNSEIYQNVNIVNSYFLTYGR